MRKYYLLLCILSLLLFPGCKPQQTLLEPINFYYPKTEIAYGVSDGTLSHVQAEGALMTKEALLTLYLKGPSTEGFRTPFPENVSVLHFTVQENTAALVLSDNYATLSGLDMTLANVCLVKTVMELVDVTSVTLSCESQSLNGEALITISEGDLLLIDDSTGVESTAATTPASASQ